MQIQFTRSLFKFLVGLWAFLLVLPTLVPALAPSPVLITIVLIAVVITAWIEFIRTS